MYNDLTAQWDKHIQQQRATGGDEVNRARAELREEREKG